MGIAGIPGDILDAFPGFPKVNGYMDIPGYNGSLGLLYLIAFFSLCWRESLGKGRGGRYLSGSGQ